ncbi:MAG: hypothetical protein FWB72_02490 [Firmicutes bacterium]|nr:hypothetical protein [Bacillota bacterium]
MTVRELIRNAAEKLQLNDAVGVTHLPPGQGFGCRDVPELLTATNRVLQEIAAVYSPLKAREQFDVRDNRIEIASLQHRLLNILSIKTTGGANVSYRVFPDHIALANGRCEIIYTYPLATLGLNDSVPTWFGLSVNGIGHGIVSEFCLAGSRLDEHFIWDRKFRDYLRIATRKKSEIRVRRRKWL